MVIACICSQMFFWVYIFWQLADIKSNTQDALRNIENCEEKLSNLEGAIHDL